MSQRYQPSSRRARSAIAGFAVLVTLIIAIGIDGLADHYHGARQAAADETAQPA
ncbi:MAG: hypothetical protein U1F25_08450 [Rubrivivax sp.]